MDEVVFQVLTCVLVPRYVNIKATLSFKRFSMEELSWLLDQCHTDDLVFVQ